MDELIIVNYPKCKRIIFEYIIGTIVGLCTLGIGFFLFYSNFFERANYLNLKNLYKYLKRNKPDVIQHHELGISYILDKNNEVIRWDRLTGRFSWHNGDYKLDNGVVVSTFKNGGIIYNWYYNRIMKMLEEYTY